MMNKLQYLVFLLCLSGISLAQDTAVMRSLGIDTNYGFLQFYTQQAGEKLKEIFDRTDEEQAVIFHYGGSHIQAERPTTYARKYLQEKYGNGGRGMIFNYGAANTYSSIHYGSTFKGKWEYAKSFQTQPKIPLGVCGMAVKTKETAAELNFVFKEKLPQQKYILQLFTDVSPDLLDFEIRIGETVHIYDKAAIDKQQTSHMIEIPYEGIIQNIQIRTLSSDSLAKTFAFYGINIQHSDQKGLVYHSLGVGAAPFRSVLQLEKMPEQARTLKPDLVILDFGTNDILYTNTIDKKLVGQMKKAIQQFRAIHPDVLIVLTSVQDLFYKGKYITAGPIFRDLVDSVARSENCLFWNWYDLSGGLGTIKTWNKMGYAQSDYVHLTAKGYETKGTWLYKSIENSLERIERSHPTSLTVPNKKYELPIAQVKDSTVAQPQHNTSNISTTPIKPVVKKVQPNTKKPRVHKVRSGDTLSSLAAKYHTTVVKIKKANGLRSDMIRIGQVLKIPY